VSCVTVAMANVLLHGSGVRLEGPLTEFRLRPQGGLDRLCIQPTQILFFLKILRNKSYKSDNGLYFLLVIEEWPSCACALFMHRLL